MASINDNLIQLAETKANIKQAIIDKGVEVKDTDAFDTYPTKIGNIIGGLSSFNATANNSLTFTPQGVVSGFNGSSYLSGTLDYSSGVSEIIIGIRIKYKSSSLEWQPLITPHTASNDCNWNIAVMQNTDISFWTSESGSMFDHSTYGGLADDDIVDLEFTMTSSSRKTRIRKNEGTWYEYDYSYGYSDLDNYIKTFYFGIMARYSSSTLYLTSSLYLDKCYISIDGTEVWRGAS